MTLCNADDLALAHTLADQADIISMDRFRALDLSIETKLDMTPVSDADRSVERALREVIQHHRPADGVIGEEFAETGNARRTWILDPIDGTKNFIRGVPIWATLIALRDERGIGIGLVSAPALGRRWWALRDHHSWVRDSPSAPERVIRTSSIKDVTDASFSFSDDKGWENAPAGLLERLRTTTWRQRAYGDFWSHCLVAEGGVDIAAEPELALYDYAALVPIITEAGGSISTFTGNPLPVFDASTHPSVLSTNGHISLDFLS